MAETESKVEKRPLEALLAGYNGAESWSRNTHEAEDVRLVTRNDLNKTTSNVDWQSCHPPRETTLSPYQKVGEDEILLTAVFPIVAVYTRSIPEGLKFVRRSDFVWRLNPGPELDAKYLVWCLNKRNWQQEHSESYGIVTARLRHEQLRRVEIPFLPLDWQRQIGNLSLIFDMQIANHQQLLETQRKMVHGVLQEATREFIQPVDLFRKYNIRPDRLGTHGFAHLDEDHEKEKEESKTES